MDLRAKAYDSQVAEERSFYFKSFSQRLKLLISADEVAPGNGGQA
jgi:hypothetical protein